MCLHERVSHCQREHLHLFILTFEGTASPLHDDMSSAALRRVCFQILTAVVSCMSAVLSSVGTIVKRRHKHEGMQLTDTAASGADHTLKRENARSEFVRPRTSCAPTRKRSSKGLASAPCSTRTTQQPKKNTSSLWKSVTLPFVTCVRHINETLYGLPSRRVGGPTATPRPKFSHDFGGLQALLDTADDDSECAALGKLRGRGGGGGVRQ
jgi:hypothetical protein